MRGHKYICTSLEITLEGEQRLLSLSRDTDDAESEPSYLIFHEVAAAVVKFRGRFFFWWRFLLKLDVPSSLSKTTIYTHKPRVEKCPLVILCVMLFRSGMRLPWQLKAQLDLLEGQLRHLSNRLLANRQAAGVCVEDPEWRFFVFTTATGKLSTRALSRRCPTVRRRSAPSGRPWGRTPGRSASREVCLTCAAPAPLPA